MKLYSLQILRAFAAISVLITHVFQKSEYKPFGAYFLSGQYGVDIFFILSGFLIYITTKTKTNHWVYLKKRVYRIYPLYIFALIFYILFDANYTDLNITVVSLIQNILMLPWDSKWSYQSLIVGVAWSTLFEMFFYMLFFFLISFKLKRQAIFIVIPLLFSIFFPISYLNIIGNDIPFISLFVSLASSFHLLKFLAGCIIGDLYVRNKIPKVNKKTYLLLLICSICFIGVVFLTKYNFYRSFIACVFLFITVLEYDGYYTLQKDKFLIEKTIYLGDISYSIYILHILIIGLLTAFEVKNILLLIASTLLFTILISDLTYRFIEKRFIQLGKK